ncbi:MAG TPA: hypothetical protein VIJ00_01140 [Nakamurella sp.]|jgi:hypothetical protein
MTKISQTAATWLTTVTLSVVARVNAGTNSDAGSSEDRDRGDVPGWVMITVMTAIVVIALLAVFRQQVVTAVQNAFESVSNAR